MGLSDSDIKNIDLSPIQKKKFTIDNDSSRVLELNTSDMGVVTRLRDAYPDLVKLAQDATETKIREDITPDSVTDEDIGDFADFVTKIDSKMRELIDFIFDANVSELCAPSGTMIDPVGGKLRFEHLFDILSKVYETNLSGELNSLRSRTQKHTSKYTKSKR